MSYATYSEVYFAINIESQNLIKIGETSNASRRSHQLSKEGYFIKYVATVNGDYSERLFVESYLRAKINAHPKTTQIRTDYFACESEALVRDFENKFHSWVTEANELLRIIQDDNATILINYDKKRPPVPMGEEKLYNRIFEALDENGVWRECFQIKWKNRQSILDEFVSAFSPFGYECTMESNSPAWTYYTIKKIN